MAAFYFVSGYSHSDEIEEVTFALGGDLVDHVPDYMVTVKIRHTDGASGPTGINVWRPDETDRTLSQREVKRLPLDRVVRAALAAATGPREQRGSEKWHALIAEKIVAPTGKPERGKSTKFYEDIAKAYRAAAANGKNPVKEIARQNGAAANTVHQWIYRARLYGHLAKSPQSRTS